MIRETTSIFGPLESLSPPNSRGRTPRRGCAQRVGGLFCRCPLRYREKLFENSCTQPEHLTARRLVATSRKVFTCVSRPGRARGYASRESVSKVTSLLANLAVVPGSHGFVVHPMAGKLLLDDGRVVSVAPGTGALQAGKSCFLAAVALNHDALRAPPVDRTELDLLDV